ncbi:MAG: AAA family ATPase, partial [Bacteroidota bacterium]
EHTLNPAYYLLLTRPKVKVQQELIHRTTRIRTTTVMFDRIYVAATSQHVGKTTSTLGIVAAIRNQGYNVGYCKPLGQEFVDLGELKVDKDALLFARTMNFELSAEKHSPVILGRGVTTSFLRNPGDYSFPERVTAASKILQEEYDIVVYEGTGHPGVGSVIDLSNAAVAKMLNASVIMIVEGGIGNTIDKLNVNLSLFREQNVPIAGVIINKVLPDKSDKVAELVGGKLKQWGIPLLGVLPYDKTLANPIMEGVRMAIDGMVIVNGHKLDNTVENIASGSLIEKREFDDLQNLLLIVSHRRLESAIRSLQEIDRQHPDQDLKLAGIVVNGENDFMSELQREIPCQDYITFHEIPLIATQLDTYGSALKISRMEVKINTRTPWKARRAVELIKDYVNLEGLF